MSKQVHIFSVDTSAFYNESELRIHRKQLRNFRFRMKLKELRDRPTTDDHTRFKAVKYLTRTNKRLEKYKKELVEQFKQNDQVRVIRPAEVDEQNLRNIISIFESVLTRTLEMEVDTISREIIVVQTYYFDILQDIIQHGFWYQNERYVCFTASAGQIREKKTIFIREATLEQYRSSLMCGLTSEHINHLGGININKYLAYLALCNSATEEWQAFDIRKCIVVDDMSTTIRTMVDYISDHTYSIERQMMDVPIEHTDGCGMILPRKSSKAMMIRLPWVKGLLIPFPFDKFIREQNKKAGHSKYGLIKDIYGVEHDILKENIEVIFTKSQFKMWKYYSSWEEYTSHYLTHNCQAGICNLEEDTIGQAKLNYQMLQTLTDITDAELKALSSKTATDIHNIGTDKATMLKIMGVVPHNRHKNPFQQALEYYPDLLNDAYSKETIKQVKKSLVRQARSGKLDVDGKYTFISPDLYAFCEHLFLGEQNPLGLLADGEVSCNLYPDTTELDCLRSPHLYREHAVRRNLVSPELKRWFITKSLYTSVHDPISKLLMFDNDGDKALVCADPTLVTAAKRNMVDIYPLYYPMAKADAESIHSDSIFAGLKAAYTGGNIGTISNNITKLWNSDPVNLDIIKILCMENNFTIDYAKTLYKPQRPEHMEQQILSHTKQKAPAFFIYAKDKESGKVETANNSVMNRLFRMIPNPRISFRQAGIGQFDYTLLMKSRCGVVLDETVIHTYQMLDQNKKLLLANPNEAEATTHPLLYQRIRGIILDTTSHSPYEVTDMLVEYLYKHKNSKYKNTLWSAFGDILLENLLRNLNKIHCCESCHSEFVVTRQRQIYCEPCHDHIRKEKERDKKRKQRDKKRSPRVEKMSL